MIFDKTGTLTYGQPVVTAVHVLPGCHDTPSQLLSLAAALERESSHPIARAITASDRESGVPISRSCLQCNHGEGRGVQDTSCTRLLGAVKDLSNSFVGL